MKLKASIFLLSLALGITGSSPANAGAGWYPTTPGDVIEVSVCLPRRHSSIIHLQGTKYLLHNTTFAKMKMKLTKDHEYCGRYSREYTFPWRVNTKGGWGLWFYDPLTTVLYSGWPDGIDSK